MKPCPFCNEEYYLKVMDLGYYEVVVCTRCGGRGPYGAKGIKDNAKDNWNKRPAESRLQKFYDERML